MRLLYSLHELLLENVNKTQFNYDKYVENGLLPFNLFKQLVFADPTAKPEEYDWQSASKEDFLENVTIGKYSAWLLKQYVKPDLPENEELKDYQRLILEDLDKIKRLLVKHNRYRMKFVNPIETDINRVKTIGQLESIKVKDGDKTYPLAEYAGKKKIVVPTAPKENDITHKFEQEGSKIILKTPTYTVVKISDKGKVGSRAASYFGGYYLSPEKGETDWCTSPENSENFNYYISKGPLYVILPNDPAGSEFGGYGLPFGLKTGLPANRFQFHFADFQFMNAADKPIFSNTQDLIDYFSEGGMFAEINPFIRAELPKAFERDSREIKEFTFDAQKSGDKNSRLIELFTGLFGMGEFFNYISDDLTTFSINGIETKDQENIFNKLKKTRDTLKHLSITNSISTLPDIFDGFNQLDSVFLRKNQGLKRLPESLLKLPNLKTIMVDEPTNIADIEKHGFVKKEGSNGVFRKK